MNDKGFIFLFEVLFVLLFASLFFSMNESKKPNPLNDLLVLQKQNDLMRAWMSNDFLSIDVMQSQAQLIFPNQKMILSLDLLSRENDGFGQKQIKTQVSFINKNAFPTKIIFVVFV